MDKAALLSRIRAALSDELTALTNAANASFAAATDPDSKAENKYDTRTLEASYVARGQAQRVAELQIAVYAFATMSIVELNADEPICVGALVVVLRGDELSHYFIASHAGGLEIEQDGDIVMVITPASPVGARLLRRRKGEALEGPGGAPMTIVSVK